MAGDNTRCFAAWFGGVRIGLCQRGDQGQRFGKSLGRKVVNEAREREADEEMKGETEGRPLAV